MMEMNDTDLNRAVPKRRFRWLRNATLVLIMLTLVVPRTGDFRITPAELIAYEHLFSLVEWEAVNFPRKWLHMLVNLVPGVKPSPRGTS